MERILLSPTMRLSDLQKVFSRIFPYLKLSFYSYPHHSGKYSAGAVLRSKNSALAALHPGFKGAKLLFSGNMRTGAFEQKLREKLGLNAQVLRRSGEYWVETAATDDWTLQEEDQKGKRSLQVLPENYYDENSFQDEPYRF
jgi:hypothetical protein